MALVVADRVKETTTTQGNGSSYALAGPKTGFESFSVIGNGNKTYYCCTDGTDFEIGIGTYTASGTTLSRHADDVLQSSNNDGLVNWGTGTKEIFVTQPADKAVFLDGSGDLTLTGDLGIGTSSPDEALHVEGSALIDAYNAGQEEGIFFREGFSDSNKYNLSILTYDHSSSNVSPDGLSINAYDGVSFSVGSNSRNEVVKIVGGTGSSAGDVQIKTGDLELGDNQQIKIGDGDDFSLQWDGTDGHITALGTLNIDGADGHEMAKFVDGGAVELYHNDVKVFETTSDGTKFHGDILIEDPSVSSSAPYLEIIGKRSDANDSYNFAGKVFLSINHTNGLVDDGKVLGTVAFGGNHTNSSISNILYGAAIHGVSEGDFNSATDMPAALTFRTGSTGRDQDTANVNINTERLRITSGGDVQVKTGHLELGDNQEVKLGDDADFIIKHSGTASIIRDTAVTNARPLYLQSDETTHGVIITKVNATEKMARFIADGACELYHNDSLRLTTTTDGVTVTGGAGDATLTIEADTDNSDENDNAALVLSQDGGSTVSRLRLGNGNATVLEAHTNGALILQSTSGDDFLVGNQNAGVELFYDGSERLTTASSGIVTKSPVLTNQVTTGDARALFTHTIVGTNNASTQYVKLATLPATSDGTLDHLTLEGQVGGWESHRQGYFRISFSRRSGFNYFYDSYGDIIGTAAIQAYTQTDNTVQIWGKFNASNYTKLSYSIPHSFQVTIEENPSFTGTAPSGTLAFDSSSSTYAPRFQVDNAGNLSATTKSFDIAHPTKDGMRLRYGSLEGPENGVYVRGRLTGSSVIELPEHWSGLVDEDSITVQLTAIGKSQDLWVEDVSIEQVRVCDANTDCFYMVMAERIDVAKLEVEYAN